MWVTCQHDFVPSNGKCPSIVYVYDKSRFESQHCQMQLMSLVVSALKVFTSRCGRQLPHLLSATTAHLARTSVTRPIICQSLNIKVNAIQPSFVGLTVRL